MSRPPAALDAAVALAAGLGMAAAATWHPLGWPPWLGFLAVLVPALVILAALQAIAEGAPPP